MKAVLFDGECNLCSGAVRFILKRDPEGHFQFASLQSREGSRLASQCGQDPSELGTIVLLEEDRCFTRSTAALRIARRLKRPWPLFYALIVVPPFLRDAAYRLVARYRYKVFGRRQQCWVPPQDVSDRFLDQAG